MKSLLKPSAVVVLALVLGACGPGMLGDHVHGDMPMDGTHDGHDALPRDPSTQPCDAGNWLTLNPDLRECRLAGEDLSGRSLRRSNLSNADLTGASLVGADLFKAVVSHARLPGADLAGANLTSVDLTGADLTGANLQGARLPNAVLTDALLEAARTDSTTVCPNGTFGPCW